MTDAEINRCRKSDGPRAGRACPDYERCLELVREEAAR
jgi:hypothetical protein